MSGQYGGIYEETADVLSGKRADDPCSRSTFGSIGSRPANLSTLKGAREVATPLSGLDASWMPAAARPWLSTVLRAIRIHQWAKNVLIFGPLLLSHKITTASVSAAILAFFCFSFVASSNYLLNDMLDVENDRRHVTKRLRPFAAGDLSIAAGVAIAVGLVIAAVGLLCLLPVAFGIWLAVYIGGSLSYSLYLKRLPVLDVLMLSGLYTIRLLAGGAATGTAMSQWLAGFSTLLFVSLAMVKRFSELESLRKRGANISHGRGYSAADMEQIRSFGTSSATAAVVVFMLYIGRQDVTVLYRHAMRLWLIVPVLIYWLFRVWLVASRGELDHDPVVFAIRDKVSLMLGILLGAIAFMAV